MPLLDVILSPGETAGAVSATVTGYVYGSLVVNITEAEVATPYVGDTAPTEGDNLVADYGSGADITTGVEAGNYLQVYDVDMEDEGRIVAFYQTELTEEDIKAADEEEGIEENVEEEEEPAEGQMMFNMRLTSLGEELTEEIPGDGIITINGTYQLPAGFSRPIIIENDATLVKIIGNDIGNTHTNTYIAVESGRSSPLTLTIENLDIQAPANEPGIDFTPAGDNAYVLDLSGSSRVEGGADCAGIHVPEGVSLTITSTSEPVGSLEAIGGQCGAGIGGGREASGGNITISGGTVTAQGGDSEEYNNDGGAGIGGGYKSTGGTIIIDRHPTVIATKADGAADIGNGANTLGSTTIKDGSDKDRYQNFTDFAQVSSWAETAVKEVLSAHVFNGTSAATISPKSSLSYAEAIQAIKNLLAESKLINQ